MDLKVVFLGNHTVGVQVLEVLHHFGCLSGVVAHPQDPEDGVRYLSVHDYAKETLKVPVIRSSPKSPEFMDFITSLKPDLIWVTDYRYLLPKEVFSLPRLGAVNLHPSLLPKYKGRASLNWALINGEKEVGLTAHFIDEGTDTGDIIEQVPLTVKDDDYIGDVLNNLYPLYKQITKEVLGSFLAGNITRYKQDISQSTVFPARKPKDGLIDYNQDATKVLNFIRALSRPYPGAFLFHENKKMIIWKAKKASQSFPIPGLHTFLDKLYLQCRDGALEIEEKAWEGNEVSL